MAAIERARSERTACRLRRQPEAGRAGSKIRIAAKRHEGHKKASESSREFIRRLVTSHVTSWLASLTSSARVARPVFSCSSAAFVAATFGVGGIERGLRGRNRGVRGVERGLRGRDRIGRGLHHRRQGRDLLLILRDLAASRRCSVLAMRRVLVGRGLAAPRRCRSSPSSRRSSSVFSAASASAFFLDCAARSGLAGAFAAASAMAFAAAVSAATTTSSAAALFAAAVASGVGLVDLGLRRVHLRLGGVRGCGEVGHGLLSRRRGRR